MSVTIIVAVACLVVGLYHLIVGLAHLRWPSVGRAVDWMLRRREKAAS